MFTGLISGRAGLVAALVAAAVLVWLLEQTAWGRLYRLCLGCFAAVLIALTAALGLRKVKRSWVKLVPIKWLQKNHIALACLTVPLTVCHLGGVRTPGSPWSWLMITLFALLLTGGAVTWFFKKKIRPTAVFVQQSIEQEQKRKAKAAPCGAAPVLNAKEKNALADGQMFVQTQEQQLTLHGSLTLAFLAALAGHVWGHLFY